MGGEAGQIPILLTKSRCGRLNGAVAQQVQQRGHISLEIVGVCRSACGDAIERGATAAEQAAQRIPQLEPRQTECR